MSVGLAEAALPATVCEEGGIAITGQLVDYLWSDLKARRNALSLWPEGLAPILGVDFARYLTYEYGRPQDVPQVYRGQWDAMQAILAEHGNMDSVPADFIDDLADMEAFVADEAETLIETAPEAGTVTLRAVADQETFTADYPAACTRLLEQPYPVTLQYVAVGRAAAELRRRGRDVEVYRGERSFDLPAGRFAVGFGKSETAFLFGINEKTYYKMERGTRRPQPVSMGELQRVDDFITELAGKLEVSREGGVNVICVLDDQDAFETAYPSARVERSGTPYPVRLMWVAAGRRAGALDAAGLQARVAVVE